MPAEPGYVKPLWARGTTRLAREMLALGLNIEGLGLEVGRWDDPETKSPRTRPDEPPPLALALTQHNGLLECSSAQEAVSLLGPIVGQLTLAANLLKDGNLPRARELLDQAKRVYPLHLDEAVADGLPDFCAQEIIAKMESLSTGVEAARLELIASNRERSATLSVLSKIHAAPAYKWDVPGLEIVASEEQFQSWRAAIIRISGLVLDADWKPETLRDLVLREVNDWSSQVPPSSRPYRSLPKALLAEELPAAETTEQALSAAWDRWRAQCATSLADAVVQEVAGILAVRGLVVIPRWKLAGAGESLPYGQVRHLYKYMTPPFTKDLLYPVDPTLAAVVASAAGRTLESLLETEDAILLEEENAQELCDIACSLQTLASRGSPLGTVRAAVEAARDSMAAAAKDEVSTTVEEEQPPAARRTRTGGLTRSENSTGRRK